MATATFKLTGKTIPQIIEIVRSTIAKVNANAAVYVTPNPSMANITLAVDTLEDSYLAAIKGGTDLKAIMRLDKKALVNNMSTLQANIQNTSGGDPAKILLVADVKKAATPVGILPAPTNLRASYGLHEGEIIYKWDGVPRKKVFAFEINDTPFDQTKWKSLGFTGKTRFIAKGLISSQNYGFRVTSVSADGMGAWSDAVYQKAQ